MTLAIRSADRRCEIIAPCRIVTGFPWARSPLAAALAGVYVARTLSQPAVAFARVGHLVAAAARARGIRPGGHARHGGVTRSLRGHPTLVFFGFTHCPDVCPTTLAMLASVQKQAALPDLKVALISVDPERDTPEQLGRYIASFGGDFIGLTGSAARDCEGQPRASAWRRPASICRRRLHHGSLGHGVRARFARRASSRCSRRRFVPAR